MIRPATENDFDALIRLGRMMHAESWYHYLPFNEEKLRGLFAYLMEHGFIRVHESSEGEIDGGFVGLLTEPWFGNGRIASDLALFILPARRGGTIAFKLLRAFVAWAGERQVDEVTLGISTGVRVEETERLYEHLGFTRVGGLFKMRLT